MNLTPVKLAHLIENYVTHIVDGMDTETMESMIFDLLTREYESYTEEQIVSEIVELYGEELVTELMEVA
jgi:hypothetical protein